MLLILAKDEKWPRNETQGLTSSSAILVRTRHRHPMASTTRLCRTSCPALIVKEAINSISNNPPVSEFGIDFDDLGP